MEHGNKANDLQGAALIGGSSQRLSTVWTTDWHLKKSARKREKPTQRIERTRPIRRTTARHYKTVYAAAGNAQHAAGKKAQAATMTSMAVPAGTEPQPYAQPTPSERDSRTLTKSVDW